MKVIVGSSDLPLSTEIVTLIASVMASADPDEAYAVRSGIDDNNPASPVERVVERLAGKVGRRVIFFSPTKGGRAATFHRDYDMVEGASEVIAFFSPEREMEGGTGHVVKAALDRGVKVSAYSGHPDGTLVYIGSDEPDLDRHAGGELNDVLRRMYEEAQGE